ncbi:hypothetical protein PTKIN_Ptkin13bG0202400 [Pterospermum kingtungense]
MFLHLICRSSVLLGIGRQTNSASQSYKLFYILRNNPSISRLPITLRFLSTTTSNQDSFTVSYLVNKLDFSLESALAASNGVQFKTPDNPDSVISFFEKLGFSKSQIATMVRRSPALLVSDVEKILLPKLEFLQTKGFSSTHLAKLLYSSPCVLLRSLEKHIIPFFNTFSNLVNSDQKTITAIRRYPFLIHYSLNVIYSHLLPNIDILLDCGVPESNIIKILHQFPGSLFISPGRLKEVVEKVVVTGLDPLELKFVHAVCILAKMSKSIRERKVEVFKKWGWSEKDVWECFRKQPFYFVISEDMIMAKMDFLVNKMGIDSSRVANQPSVLAKSLEKRLVPRGLIAQHLLSKGLIKDFKLSALFDTSEKMFLKIYVTRHEAEAPELLKLYKQKLKKGMIVFLETDSYIVHMIQVLENKEPKEWRIWPIVKDIQSLRNWLPRGKILLIRRNANRAVDRVALRLIKMQHFEIFSFHDHPLMLVDQDQISNENEKRPYCSGCGEVVLLSASTFSCLQCNYHLHKECALAPYRISTHPLHPYHSAELILLRKQWTRYGCALCKEKRDVFFYRCVDCRFGLDIECSLLSNKVGESMCLLKDDAHGNPHPFFFLPNHKDQLKKFDCSWCHQSLLGSVYFSDDCEVGLHKKCFDELPTEIDHPCHHLHTLFLQSRSGDQFCHVCRKEVHGHNLFYRCFACDFDIHLECMWPRPIIEDKRFHEHQFTLLFRNDSFICNACGTSGKFVSYICPTLTCHLQVHKGCTSLPRIIKVTRHDHALGHKYFLKKKVQLEKVVCGICFDEVKTEHGSYCCLRKDCNFIVHVKCATEDEYLYYIVDQDEEELDKTNNSSITCVIEVNEHGEAIKILHFSHEHNLVLEDKIKEDSTDRYCDGCMLSISTSTPLYYCSEYCNFFLHKSCAELPKIKHHWFHRFVTTLVYEDLVGCDLCDRTCSGLFYTSSRENRRFDFCLRCATVPNVIKLEGHKHILFYDYKCKGQCNGCGDDHQRGAFRCKECNFSLDFACITLPPAIRHKCDAHLLELSYPHDDDDTELEHVCDACEGERDPNRCYYYCPSCDNSVHPKCVLGELPFVKDGVTFTPVYTGHQHDVSLVRKVDGYHYCVNCGHLCQDEEVLKCWTCNFIIHLKCSISLKRGRLQFYTRYGFRISFHYDDNDVGHQPS